MAALGTSVAFILNDQGSLNTYTGNGFIEEATHNMSGGDVDTLTISLIVDGTIA